MGLAKLASGHAAMMLYGDYWTKKDLLSEVHLDSAVNPESHFDNQTDQNTILDAWIEYENSRVQQFRVKNNFSGGRQVKRWWKDYVKTMDKHK